jgi:hypothetical protein
MRGKYLLCACLLCDLASSDIIEITADAESNTAFDQEVPSPKRHPKFMPLLDDGSICVAKGFLSAEEIKYLLSFIKSTGGWESSHSGGKHFKVTRRKQTGGNFEHKSKDDPIIRRIEERIANATGIPMHPHEDMISLAKITPRGKSPRGGYFPPFGLHHETDTRPYRARTVLIYLKGVKSGGRTIFPLLGHHGDEEYNQLRLQKFDEALSQQWGDDAPHQRHSSFDIHTDHPFNELLTDVCRGQHGISVAPKKGWALMFDSMVAPFGAKSGRYHYHNRTWHAGCNVIEGTKIILQKFKELPLSQREGSLMPRSFEYNSFLR